MSTKRESKKRRPTKFKKGLGTKRNFNEDELRHLEKIILGTGSEVFQESHSEEDSDTEISKKRKKEVEAKKPAWVDEDDDATFKEVINKQQRRCNPGVWESVKYQDIAKEKYEGIMGVPKWSRQTKEDLLEKNLLNRCGNFIKKPKFLGKGILRIQKLKDLNYETHQEGPIIKVIKFHTKSTLAMVAGSSGRVSLFQVDGNQNSKLLSINFLRYPIECGSFLRNGEEFLIGSRFYRYFYCHNLVKGNSMKIDNFKMIGNSHTKKFCVSPNDDFIAVDGDCGKIYLLAASTKEYIDSFQMNCSLSDFEFSQDGSLLYSHGEEGEIYIWDVRARRCIKKFYDEGCVKGTSISISPNNQFLACGSNSGVINVYNTESLKSEDTPPSPIKSIFNLVTPITSLKFNSSSEILAAASDAKKDAVKLIHCSSMTVFSYFPSLHSKIKVPTCLDFSPNSGYFAVGNDKGSAHLFRLKYYGNY